MFEVRHLKNNTFYYEAFTNVGIYRLNSEEAVLIDSCDHPRMVRGLDRELENMGLKVKSIINTHCHVDHICGNRYFQNKYGCSLLSTKKEQSFIYYTETEAEFYNAGLTVNKSTNPFYGAEASEAEVITSENIPEGFEIIDLPGHGFEMIGVRTPDDIVFLADSVLSVATWESYRLPFFHEVNRSLETLGKICELKASLFVPSHNPPVEDIRELARYNIERLTEKKQLVLENCEGRGFDELFAVVMNKEGLNIKTHQYCMYAVMLRNLLQALIEDDAVYSELENGVMKYHRK